MIDTLRKLVVFDLDDTLLNSGKKVIADAVEAFHRAGYEVSEKQVRETEWFALAQSRGISPKNLQEQLNAVKQEKPWAYAIKSGEVRLFPDTLPCLNELREMGIELAILTQSIPGLTDEKVGASGLREYFQDRIAVTPRDAPNKENEARELVRRLNPYFALFIGDKPGDVLVERALPSEIRRHGVYIDRTCSPVPKELSTYIVISTLRDLPEIVKRMPRN